MKAVFLITLLAVGGPDDDARAALALAAAQQKPATPAKAVVGPALPDADRLEVTEVSSGYTIDWTKKGKWFTTIFDHTWTREKAVEHVKGLQREGVRQTPRPFRKLGQLLFGSSEPVSADADETAIGRLPAEVAFLADMEEYQAAKLVQVSGNRTGRGVNWSVPRSTAGLDLKWSAPGGLAGVDGWYNVLLRSPGNRSRTWLDHKHDETDPVPLYISPIVYQRSYDDGAKFADILVNASTDRVFEVRTAEKKDGAWHRVAAWRDRSAYPAGYRSVAANECATCHDQAGGGGYGSARIPGGDGILSEPLSALEH